MEIHTNPSSRSMLVRIPSDYLRQKILEKSAWYVGDSMFHAVQWSSSASATKPPLETIQLWAHLTGVPLNLRHTDGLSLVAGLVGEPKKTDDFTKNLVSLTLSHVKVAVDLSKPLPSVVEFSRENGEVVEVQVAYPWIPPTCSHCKELGHIARNCLLLPPPEKSVNTPAKKVPKSTYATLREKNKGPLDPQRNTKVDVASSTTAIPPSHPIPISDPKTIFPLTPTHGNLHDSSVNTTIKTTPSKLPLNLVKNHPKKPLPSGPLIPTPSNPQIPSDPLSPPDSSYAPSLKRPRPASNPKTFPSFTDQLSYFASFKSPLTQTLTLPQPCPSSVILSKNSFPVLAPDGSILHEETID